MTAEQVLRKAAEKLRAAQIENASFDASCLVESITGLSRAKIMLCDDDISDGQAVAAAEITVTGVNSRVED